MINVNNGISAKNIYIRFYTFTALTFYQSQRGVNLHDAHIGNDSGFILCLPFFTFDHPDTCIICNDGIMDETG